MFTYISGQFGRTSPGSGYRQGTGRNCNIAI